MKLQEKCMNQQGKSLKSWYDRKSRSKNRFHIGGPIVEQLGRFTGETIDSDIASRINELKQDEASAQGAGQEMGLTEAIRWVFSQPLLLPLTPTQSKRSHG
jgi:hypothetical protein